MIDNFVAGSIIDMDRNNQNTMLNTLYDIVYDKGDNGEFVYLDKMIEYMEQHIELYSDILMLGILTSTLPYKNRLHNRKKYFDRVKSEIIKREGSKEIDSLLYGLE